MCGLIVGVTTGAQATHDPGAHVKGSYPNVGYLFVNTGSNGTVLVSADRCKPAELDFFAAANQQLRGSNEGNAGQYSGKWPNGIDFTRFTCPTTSINNNVSLHWNYMTTAEWIAAGHSDTFGGHSHSTMATATWCGIWAASYPCGYHPTIVHVNEPRYANYTQSYKPLFLAHESGHGIGFRDYCGHVSVSNDGANCSISTGYQTLDRTMLRSYIYP